MGGGSVYTTSDEKLEVGGGVGVDRAKCMYVWWLGALYRKMRRCRCRAMWIGQGYVDRWDAA